MVKTKRRTFVIGLCVTIDSIVYLFKKLLLGDGVNGICLKYLPTYRLSQDNIEIMFGIIRRRGGWSNNPTALQFSYAFRAVLSPVGVVGSHSSDVLVAAVLFQLWFFSFSYGCDLSVTVSVTVMHFLFFSFSYSCGFSVTVTVIVFQFIFLFQLVIFHKICIKFA